MNGPVGKGGSAIMTVSMSQSHTQKAMLRKRRRRREKRREYQKGNLVHVLRASGNHFQITSVHRLGIGFPGGRKVALASQLVTKRDSAVLTGIFK